MEKLCERVFGMSVVLLTTDPSKLMEEDQAAVPEKHRGPGSELPADMVGAFIQKKQYNVKINTAAEELAKRGMGAFFVFAAPPDSPNNDGGRDSFDSWEGSAVQTRRACNSGTGTDQRQTMTQHRVR